MADSTVTGLSAASALAGTETFPVVQSGSKKATINQVKDLINTVAPVTTANAMAALAIDVTKSLNTKSVAADSTFTFSGAPASSNTWFTLRVTNTDTNPHTITIPSTFDVNRQATSTSFTILASGVETITWCYDGTTYYGYGIPEAGYSAEVTVASATTTDIGAAASVNVSISGTTTITGLGTVAAGTYRQGRFTGALTLTHNATSLIIPGGVSITTAAGDRFGAYSLGSGNWVVLWYVKASGQEIWIPTNAISASDIDWAAARTHSKTLAANTTFTFSNAKDGQTVVVDLLNTASNYTVTWPTVLWSGGAAPTMTTGAKHDIYTFVKIGSNIFGSAVQNIS